MNIEQAIQKIYDVGIIPVVRASGNSEAEQLVEAICAGGISVVEITMTVPGAVDAIRAVVRTHAQNVLVGAGTVVSEEQAAQCIDVGAQFLVSPGISIPVLKLAAARGVLAIPGALTPSEVISAQQHGAKLIKIFPCSSAGGPAHIQALRGPFPDALLIPTGGVTLSTAGSYFAAGAYAIGVGSDLANLAALRTGRSQEITQAAQEFVRIVQQARSAKTPGRRA
jgi:2-dehydro-3-deoxyphosphogluconate aldolase/(4S)-4-hydroxy-2-oxoglutarate aldolase